MYTRQLIYWIMTDSSGLMKHYQQVPVNFVLFSHSALINEVLEVLMFSTDLEFFCTGK